MFHEVSPSIGMSITNNVSMYSLANGANVGRTQFFLNLPKKTTMDERYEERSFQASRSPQRIRPVGQTSLHDMIASLCFTYHCGGGVAYNVMYLQ